MLSMFLYSSALQAGSFLVKSFISADKVTEQVNPITKQIHILDETKNTLQAELDVMVAGQEKIALETEGLKTKISQAPLSQTDFLNKKLSIINRTYQESSDAIKTQRTLITLVNEHRTILQEYQDDPRFSSLCSPLKATSDFDDLQKSAHRLFTHKGYLDEYEKNKKSLEIDLDKRRRSLDTITKEYLEKKELHQNFLQSNKIDESLAGFTRNEQGDIIDEQMRELEFKQKHAELKVREDSLRIDFIESKIFIAKKQIMLLQKEYSRVKRSLNIDTSYIKTANDKLEAKRQEFFTQRENLQKNILILQNLQEAEQQKITAAIHDLGISSNDALALLGWTKDAEAMTNQQDLIALGILAPLSSEEHLIDTQIELLNAQINQEYIDFRFDEREFEILKSWYRTTQQKFRFNADEEIDKEIQKYRTERAQLKLVLVELYEKRDNIINLLAQLNIIRDKIKTLVAATSSLKNHKNVNQEVVSGLIKADDDIRKRINFIGKLLEIYAKSIAKVRDGIKKVEDINVELSSKGFWMRSTKSIEWNDLKNFIPNIKRFIADVKATGVAYLKKASISDLTQRVQSYWSTPYFLLLLLLRCMLIIIIYVLLRMYLPDFYHYLVHGESRYQFLTQVRAFLAALIEFMIKHLSVIYCWLLLFVAIQLKGLNYYCAIWFYLFSIPFLWYLSYLFIQHIIMVNKNRGYIFIGQSYQHRFMVVLSSLTYATIMILFFRAAFMVGNYGSAVPDILLALNFILAQIAAISLIGKDHILHLFTGKSNPILQWLEEKVENYYYLFLLFFIVIIVMSNPYVGYGRQVLYVLSRLLMTVLLIPIFSWFHNRIKRSSSDFFFYYSDGSTVKERFPAGKVWYGFFIIATFIFFLGFGVMIGGWIWGQTITIHDLAKYLHHSLYSPGIDEITNKPIEVTLYSLVKIVWYVIAGLGIAYVINRFILGRIFDPLLVGAGVQNTILTLCRYAVVVVALLIGLQSAGLDSMATKLAVVIVALGFAIKEPVADFISYFIILVQRPVKVGDLIQIEPDIMGIVRHITPRSTIVRHKNSLTLIVPNSRIITATVRNWHYSRTFGAFRDIELTLPYSIDPDQARRLMFEVLDNNINILKNPTPIVWLIDFAENGYRFMVRGFLSPDKISEIFEIESQVRLELVRRLTKEGIRIAVPTRVITMKQDSMSPDSKSEIQ